MTEHAVNAGKSMEKSTSLQDAHNLNSLSTAVRDNIALGKKLNDVAVNMAQNILHVQFPEVKGLHDTVMGIKKFPQEKGSFVQILHHSDHWIVVGGLENGQVDVYDTLSSGVLSSGFVSQINTLRGLKKGAVLNIKSCQQQDNGVDCGVFAIANAYALCTGVPVGDLRYNAKKMREHLVMCLCGREFSPFPAP